MTDEHPPLPFVPELNWLSAGDNPFGIRCLDIRGLTRTMLATTASEPVAHKFSELRNSRGGHVINREPEDAVSMECGLSYPHSGNAGEGPLYRADVMEEKWDIFLLGEWMYFARSWTGELPYRAGIRFFFDRVEIVSILAAGRLMETGPQQVVCDVDYLIKSCLFRRDAPHCIPRSLAEDELGIAAYSFSHFGRLASYASYEDTSKVPLTRCMPLSPGK